MPARKKVADADLIASYQRTKSVHRTGAEFGMNGSSVHERLVGLGVAKPVNVFTDEDAERLRTEYLFYRDAGKLGDLAAKMGRTRQFICRQARLLGLTDRNCQRSYAGKWKYMGEDVARVLMDDFKATKATLGMYCTMHEYSETAFWQTMTRYFPDEWEHVIESKAPKSSMYRLGRALEYSVKRKLAKEHGYFVLRSPASKSPLDLVAVRKGEVVFIQCKRSGSMGPAEWNEFFDLSVSVGATPVMAERTSPKTIQFSLLTGRKSGKKERQPMCGWAPGIKTGDDIE